MRRSTGRSSCSPAARRIVVFGGGREKLQIMGFAMRLYHMGLAVAVEGDMTTPPVGQGDLFLVTCGPGEISTALALMGVARAAGATTLLITAQPEGRAAALGRLRPAPAGPDHGRRPGRSGAARCCPWARCSRGPCSCCSRSWCSS